VERFDISLESAGVGQETVQELSTKPLFMSQKLIFETISVFYRHESRSLWAGIYG
jgi:hypothetical protein